MGVNIPKPNVTDTVQPQQAPGGGANVFQRARGVVEGTRQTPTPQAAPQADPLYDLIQPGAGEQAVEANAGFYGTPGAVEQLDPLGLGGQYTQGLLGDYGGQVGGANPTAQAYEQFQATRPDIAGDPGLDPYFQNAQRRALEAINQNAASRGAYGSSAALAEGSEAITNLQAEQAGREAQYNLQRLGEQRAWEGLGGQLAGQQAQSQLGWAQGLGGLGLQAEMNEAQRAALAQQGGLARTGQGFQQQVTGQGLREQRLQNMLNNMFRQQELYLPQTLGWQGQTFAGDEALLSGQLGGQLAGAAEAANQQQKRSEQFMGDLGAAGDIYSSFGGGG